jgi:CBS domain containing-hemolysin-like protein
MLAIQDIPPVADPNWLGIAFNCGLLLILVLLSGTFSGSETVLFSLSHVQLEQQAASGNPFRRLAARLMQHPKRTLTMILVGNTAVNVLLFATSYVLFRDLAARAGAWVTPVSGVVSVLLVVVGGEVVPKVLGATLTLRLTPISAGVVHFSGFVLRPAAALVNALIVEPLTRILFGRPGHAPAEGRRLSSDELKTLLEMSRRRGLIDATEDVYLREVIDLGEIRARDVMIPRVEVKAFDINDPPDQLRELMRETHLTKIPVFDGDKDNIVGLVYAKVLFFEPNKNLRQIATPVRYVPEVITGEQLLAHFRDTRSQIAIAVDEFGGMAGLVTLEDVLEAIVGDIHDPEDEPDEPEIVQLSDTEYEVSGRLSVHYWTEMFGVSEVARRAATVAGLVTARLGRHARVDDAVTIGNVRIRVLSVREHLIERLRVSLLDETAADQEAPA